MLKSCQAYSCVLVREKEYEYKVVADNALKVVDLLRSIELHNSPEEKTMLICFDSKMQVIGLHEVAHGGLNLCPVDIKAVMKRALLNNAGIVILAHNHPSGNCEPSRADDELTARLKSACDIMGIKLADHIILTDIDWYSYTKNTSILE